MDRVLVTGGSGFLGSNITRMLAGEFEVHAAAHSFPLAIPGTKSAAVDVTDSAEVRALFSSLRPELVIHTAALTNVDYCESHPQETWSVNVDGTMNVAECCREIGCRLVHISTDSVFDGSRGMYTENDAPQPVNAYARSKLEAERRVSELMPEGIIVRMAFFGWSLRDRMSLAEWVVSNLRQGRSINMFTDVFFSPVFVEDLVRTILALCRRKLSGLYHLGGSRRCSKYDFGVRLARAMGLPETSIRASSVADASLGAPRPRDISLDVGKVSRDTGMGMPGFAEGIERFRDSEPNIAKLRRALSTG